MPFDLRILTSSSVPIFRQIVDQVRLAVATHQLRTGDALPSVRALAEQLIINPNTVAKAYSELSRDGVITTHQGKGVFIAEPREVYTAAERQRRLQPLIDALAREALALGYGAGEVQKMLRAHYDSLLVGKEGKP